MNLYESTRDVPIHAAAVPDEDSFASGWYRWPTVKSLACLLLKLQLAWLLASLIIAAMAVIPVVVFLLATSRW
jgi:hypothetical protein